MVNIFEGIDFSDFDKVEENQQKVDVKQGASNGYVELLIADIIEDPDQPRRYFDQSGVQELADSIKKRGVVQPIIVRPKNENGKYVIVMGARRWRASQLAGVHKIPATIRITPSDGYDQMIENIQRENLCHTDIARFIEQEMAVGQKPSHIALLLGKPRSWVSLYIGFSQMHEAIQNRIEEFGIRTAYELHKAMAIDEAATLTYIENSESISQREAIVFVRNLKKNFIIEPGEDIPTQLENRRDGKDSAEKNILIELNHSVAGSKLGSLSDSNVSLENKQHSSLVAIIVQVGERVGRLMTDMFAKQGSQFGIVCFDNGATLEAVCLSDIKLIEIITIE